MPKGTKDDQTTEIVLADQREVPVAEAFDPISVMARAEEVVAYVQAKIDAHPALRKKFIVSIQGKDYPTVEWWSAVAAPFGLMAVAVARNPGEPLVRRVDDEYDGAETHEATAELYDRAGNVIGRAEMICSATETRWNHADSYARKSMAQTRARGKVLRNSSLSFLAVLAGLEATPAAEVPPGGFGKGAPAAPAANRYDAFNEAWDKIMKAVGEDDPDVVVAMRGAYVYALAKGRTTSLTGLKDDELKKATSGLKAKSKKKAVEWFTSGNWKISQTASGLAPDGGELPPPPGPTCHVCGRALTHGEADGCEMMKTKHTYCKEHIAAGKQQEMGE